MRDEEYLKNLGIEIRVWRLRKRITAEQLSKLSGLSLGAVFAIEKGKSDVKILNLKKLCDAMDVPLKEIV